MRRRVVLSSASLIPIVAAARSALASFPAPITADPIDNYTAQINVNYNTVQSFSEPIGFNSDTFTQEPDVYWFKYVSDGKTQVTFDTLGSNFSTGAGGGVLPSSNQSQIAVYNSSGSLMGMAKNAQDINGNPIAVYPTYSNDPSQWYAPEGLTQLYFTPNAPGNPHWFVSPTSPNAFTGWSAPGNSGNSQRYYPPDYPTSLNEYQVWNTSLSKIILDNNGNPVINPDTGQPYQQPGWRYYDYDRVGPGSPWNQYNVLPAGTYYIAVASDGVVLSGDTYQEKILEAPISYDPTTGQNNVPQLSGDMGAWQYYEGQTGSPYAGTIELNVTQTALPTQLTWNNSGASGNGTTWDTAVNANWNDGTQPATFSNGSDVIFNSSNNGHYNVTLNTAVSPGFVYVNNTSGNYVISGAGGITGTAHLDKNGSGTLTLSTVNTYTGGTAVDGGTLVVGVNGGIPQNSALEIHNGATVRLGTDSGGLVLSSLYMSDLTTLDIGNNHVIINYPSNDDPISSIAALIKTGYANGAWTGVGITSSDAQLNGAFYGIGYADAADPGNPAGLASGTIEIAYTLLGDADLNHIVNGIDFGILAANFNKGVTGWDQGDFDYNNIVNGVDFGDLAANFNKGASGASALAALEAFAAANGLLADVPEPGSAALLGVAGFGLLQRRGRKRSVE